MYKWPNHPTSPNASAGLLQADREGERQFPCLVMSSMPSRSSRLTLPRELPTQSGEILRSVPSAPRYLLSIIRLKLSCLSIQFLALIITVAVFLCIALLPSAACFFCSLAYLIHKVAKIPKVMEHSRATKFIDWLT